MKTKMKSFFKNTLVAMSVFGCLISSGAYAEGGNMDHRGGNGGISLVSEFSAIAKNISVIWEDICANSSQDNSYCNYLRDFQELLDIRSDRFVKVLARHDVLGYDGKPREAINNGIDEIIINSQLWEDKKDLNDGTIRKVRLVLHEYASIMRLDSSDYYAFSNELYSLFARKNYNLDILAGNEILPHRCSLGVYGNRLTNAISQNLQEVFRGANYRVVSSREKSRYKVKVYSTCSTETLSNTCGLYYQQYDSFTGRIVVSDLVVDNQMFTGDTGVLRSLSERIAGTIRRCR